MRVLTGPARRQDITEIVVHSLRGPEQARLAVPQAGPNATDAERPTSPDGNAPAALGKRASRRVQRSAPQVQLLEHLPQQPARLAAVREDPFPLVNTHDEVFTYVECARLTNAVSRVQRSAPTVRVPEKPPQEPVRLADVREDPCHLVNIVDEVFTYAESTRSHTVKADGIASRSAPTKVLRPGGSPTPTQALSAVVPKGQPQPQQVAADAAHATGAASEDSAQDLSLENAMKYYMSCDEVQKLQIQCGGLALIWVLGCLSFPFTALLIMVRVFFSYLQVKANVAVTEKSFQESTTHEAELTSEDPNASQMQKTQVRAQRSARPGVQHSAPSGTASPKPAAGGGQLSDVGMIFCPVPNGLKITALKPGTSAADSDLIKGDTVFMIDEQFTAGISMSDAIAAMCGPRHSSVELTARRDTKKISTTILRDIAHSPAEWEARWKAASEASKFSVARILEPLSAAARGCIDIATGRLPIRSLINKVRGVVVLGASSVKESISPDAKLAAAKKKREAALATEQKSMQEAVCVCVCVLCVCVHAHPL